MDFHVARILMADDGFGHFQVANIENVSGLPADFIRNGRVFTHRQISDLNASSAGVYRWPIGPGYAVTLHDDPAQCRYFTPLGDEVELQFVPAAGA
jgi:hypothetical protein